MNQLSGSRWERVARDVQRRVRTCLANSSRRASSSFAFSSASWAALKRLDLCWFILARGATPSAGQECSQQLSSLLCITLPTPTLFADIHSREQPEPGQNRQLTQDA